MLFVYLHIICKISHYFANAKGNDLFFCGRSIKRATQSWQRNSPCCLSRKEARHDCRASPHMFLPKDLKSPWGLYTRCGKSAIPLASSSSERS